MKTKSSCLFLALIITLQSCTVYKKTPVSIAEASESNQKVLLITTKDKRIPLKRIERTDSLYYGIKKVKGENVRVQINELEVKKIRPYNRGGSNFATIGLVFTSIVAVLLGVLINDFNNSWGSFGDEN
ncbi:hypothetical protein [Flavobacterium sp. XGLA_31]|uniref:hypothetical protein n=1 Tax=Flavobacterium sp. XGLA_31 TaxID=3447666 RepID=UPI003F32908C